MANYRVIIAGSRKFKNYDILKSTVDSVMKYVLWNRDDTATFVSGHADGADMLGEQYAGEKGCHCDIFPAEWERYGKTAGFIRNERMAQFATADGYKGVLIAFYNGNVSGGTKNMIDYALRYEMFVYVVKCRDNQPCDSFWKLSNKQDDEFDMYPASKRYKVSLLDSECPTGLCDIAMLTSSDCGGCEDCDGIFCYDKSTDCYHRNQLAKCSTGYGVYHPMDHLLKRDDCMNTLSIINDFKEGRITETEIRSTFEKFVTGAVHPNTDYDVEEMVDKIVGSFKEL